MIIAERFCELCMPEAFCGIETVRKKVLLNLWDLWEKKLPYVREKTPLRERKNSPKTYSMITSTF